MLLNNHFYKIYWVQNENVEKSLVQGSERKYRQIFLKISTKFLKNIDKFFENIIWPIDFIFVI